MPIPSFDSVKYFGWLEKRWCVSLINNVALFLALLCDPADHWIVRMTQCHRNWKEKRWNEKWKDFFTFWQQSIIFNIYFSSGRNQHLHLKCIFWGYIHTTKGIWFEMEGGFEICIRPERIDYSEGLSLPRAFGYGHHLYHTSFANNALRKLPKKRFLFVFS